MEDIISGKESIDTWIDTMYLGAFDASLDHSALGVQFFEAVYPELADPKQILQRMMAC